MVVPQQSPSKFYGSSLPRPRIYTEMKLNEERVDPPVSVVDPLLSWAQDAHWTMGGLSFQRHRLQGRIEGNVNKLRSERETHFKKMDKTQNAVKKVETVLKRKRKWVVEEEDEEVEEVVEGV